MASRQHRAQRCFLNLGLEGKLKVKRNALQGNNHRVFRLSLEYDRPQGMLKEIMSQFQNEKGLWAGVRQVIHHPQQPFHINGKGRMGILHLCGGKVSRFLR